MDNKGFELLQEVIAARNNKERYGVSNFVELAIEYNRIPSCPRCSSTDTINQATGLSPVRFMTACHTQKSSP